MDKNHITTMQKWAKKLTQIHGNKVGMFDTYIHRSRHAYRWMGIGLSLLTAGWA